MRSTLPENSLPENTPPENSLPTTSQDSPAMGLPTPEQTGRASLSAMVGIEARRFARHPLFLLGALLTYAATALAMFSPTYTAISGEDLPTDLLGFTIMPAFFIGMTSLIVAARLTRSTEVSLEAVSTAPGTEARRTLAVAGACVVPLIAGVIWLVELLILVQVRGHYPQEMWFGNVPALDVWAVLISCGVVSCLGGALLGVLVGRWLRFPGAAIVTVVAVVAVVMGGQMWYAYEDGASRFRLFLPWVMWHPGTFAEEGGYQGIPQFSQAFLPGNATAYLVYVLALCALAVGGAVWHDRTARTPHLRWVLIGLIAFAALAMLLAMTTGNQEILISDPLPILEQPL